MRDIRNVDSQQPVLAFRVDGRRNRVVEVAGIDRVYGDDRVVGEILAIAKIVLAESCRRQAGLRERVQREFVWNSKSANYRQRIDARVAGASQHFHNDTLATIIELGELQ